MIIFARETKADAGIRVAVVLLCFGVIVVARFIVIC